MKNSSKISVVINTYNAEKHLRRVLESAKGFDEIVICDMESTDQTVAIAQELGCKIVVFPKNGHRIVEPARNFAIQSASSEWVLVIDADETISADLRNYLYKEIQQPTCLSGIYIPRKNYFMGRFMHCHYPDYLLRFFKREVTTWPPLIHTSPTVQGELSYIPRKHHFMALEHLANDGVSDIVRKTNEYTDYEIIKKKEKQYGVLAFCYRPFFRFFKAYFLKGGIRDGQEGFIRACLEAYYQFVMLSKIVENKKRENKVD